METAWAFDNCEHVAADVEAYWQKKAPRVERLLGPWKDELKRLRGTLYYHPTRRTWECRMVLQLPSGVLAAEDTAHAWTEAIDEATDELVRQIKRHKELLREEHLYKRRARRREQMAVAGELLQRDVESRRREAFFQLLRPFLDQIWALAKRELQVLEEEGTLQPGEVSPEDLLDDVMLRAWERFDERPREIPLDAWLVSLLDERLNELASAPKERSLEEPVEVASGRDEVDEDDVDEVEYWAEQFFLPSEEVTLEELIPDHEFDTDWWAELSEEEQRAEVERLLRGLPRHQRQALLLQAMEGYSLDEIAMLQDRTKAEVARDIQAAKQTLLRRLSERRSEQKSAAAAK